MDKPYTEKTGGSYVRDPKTGAVTKRGEKPADTATKKPAETPIGTSTAASPATETTGDTVTDARKKVK